MDNDKLFERLQKANPKIDLKIGDDDVFNYERISFVDDLELIQNFFHLF